MQLKSIISFLLILFLSNSRSFAQDSTDLMKQLEKQIGNEEQTVNYVTSTFKTTR